MEALEEQLKEKQQEVKTSLIISGKLDLDEMYLKKFIEYLAYAKYIQEIEWILAAKAIFEAFTSTNHE